VSVVVYECTDVEAARAQLDATRAGRTTSDSHDPDITQLWFCEHLWTYDKSGAAQQQSASQGL
jgi:hypothetical protein